MMHLPKSSGRAARHIAAAAFILLSLGGCAMIREDAAPSPQLPAEKIKMSQSIKLAREGWPEANWWHRYADAQLDTLVARALNDAPALAVARARVAASHARVRQAEASEGLLVAASAIVDRQSVSQSGFLGPYGSTIPALGTSGPWYTAGTIGLAGEYNFDVWGKNHDHVAATIGVENASRAEAAQAELLLSAQVVRLYYDIQTQYANSALLKQIQAIETEAVTAHRARAERGVEPRTVGEQTQVRRAALDQQIEATDSHARVLLEALRTTIGAGPDELSALKAAPLPEESSRLPATLGFELLAHRADLQAMRWYVQASLDQVEAAKAAFYPSFDIKAFMGFDALHLGDLLHERSRQLNLIPGMTLPIFDSGRLNANLAGVRSRSNVLIAQYNESVLAAVREVSQSAIELQSLQRQAKLQAEQLQSSEFTAAGANAHYQRGLSDKVAALQAQLPYLQKQQEALQLKRAQIQTEISLISALGGGYALPKQ